MSTDYMQDSTAVEQTVCSHIEDIDERDTLLLWLHKLNMNLNDVRDMSNRRDSYSKRVEAQLAEYVKKNRELRQQKGD